MTAGRAVRVALYGALAALYALHQDAWFRHDPRIVLGLPVGLAYHVAYCVAASLLMALLVKLAWPAGLETDGDAP
ncbi:MAG TPA: DUF3311 domain-containing protein [Thermoanaerobaculia bacterium]|jgi:hypothetical protein